MISQERKDYPYYIGNTISLFMRRLNQEEFLCFIEFIFLVYLVFHIYRFLVLQS